MGRVRPRTKRPGSLGPGHSVEELGGSPFIERRYRGFCAVAHIRSDCAGVAPTTLPAALMERGLFLGWGEVPADRERHFSAKVAVAIGYEIRAAFSGGEGANSPGR